MIKKNLPWANFWQQREEELFFFLKSYEPTLNKSHDHVDFQNILSVSFLLFFLPLPPKIGSW